MKTLTGLLILVALALPMLAQTRNHEFRADIEQDIPLAEAIGRANEQSPDAQPLTEQEVVAAVQAIKLKRPEIDKATYQLYQRVVKERVLPKGMYFSRISEWHTPYGHFRVEWQDLLFRGQHVDLTDEQNKELLKERLGVKSLPSTPDQGVFVGGFNYRIRARFISSEPLTEEESKAMRERAPGVEQGAPPNAAPPRR